jgi:protein O-mannosyl-transferase
MELVSRNKWLLPGFLLALCAGLYWPVINQGFIWDDFNYILNRRENLPDFWPVTYAVLDFLHALFNESALGYHVVNVALFAFSVLLVYRLFKSLGFKTAWLIAALYAVHPMNVEVVAWIFQIKTNLANIFALISLIVWREKRGRYISLLFFTLAMLTKISFILLPVVLLAYERIESGRWQFRLWPFFFVSFFCGALNVFWDHNAFPLPPSEWPLDPDPLFRLLLAGKTFGFYLMQTFAPKGLTFVHPRWELSTTNPLQYLPSLALFSALAFLGYQLWLDRKPNSFLLGLGFSFCFLFPVLGFAEIYFMRFSYVAEHWLTLGMLGFVAPSCEFLYERLKVSALSFVGAAIAGILFFLSFEHLNHFTDQKTLLEQNLSVNPKSFLAHNLIAEMAKSQGDLKTSAEHWHQSANIHPTAQAYYSLAMIDEAQGQIESAESNYLKASELNPYMPNISINLGVLAAKKGDLDRARSFFEKALDQDPDSELAKANLKLLSTEGSN